MLQKFFIILLLTVIVNYSHGKWIIKNELELKGRCMGLCDTIGGMSNKFGCKYVTKCQTNTKGWYRGLLTCDFCRCWCDEDVKTGGSPNSAAWKTAPMFINEYDLYGTCRHSGCKGPDLIRTDYKGCKEIRNCATQKNGGYRQGFLYCSNCLCECRNEKVINKYRLQNVKWDLGTVMYTYSNKMNLATSVVENQGDTPQQMSTNLGYRVVRSTTWSNSLEVGLSRSIEISAGMPIISDMKVKVSQSQKFSSKFGATNSEWRSGSVTATVTVKPKSRKTVTLVGDRYKVVIRYTGDLVTMFEDGSQESKKTSGTMENIDVAKFTVTYTQDEPL